MTGLELIIAALGSGFLIGTVLRLVAHAMGDH